MLGSRINVSRDRFNRERNERGTIEDDRLRNVPSKGFNRDIKIRDRASVVVSSSRVKIVLGLVKI